MADRSRTRPVRPPRRGRAAAAIGATLAVTAAAGCGPRGPRPAAAESTTAGPATAPAPAGAPTTAAPTTAAPSTALPPTAAPTTVRSGPPWPVTTEAFPLVDTSRPTVDAGRTISPHRALTTDVWVPAAPGRRPLVVFASGFDVGPDTYRSMLHSWAAAGYVVAAPEFPLADPAVAGADVDEADMDNQPADVRYVTDWMVGPADPLAARIDAARVAVAGHSDGGETALAAAVDPAPPGQPVYRAVVAMSVQPVTSGPSTNPPVLITQGDADTINPPPLGYQTFGLARAPKYLLVLHGGGHLPPLQDGSSWLAGIEAVTEAFLDTYVAGHGTPAAIAAAAASAGPARMSLQSAP